MTFKRREDMAFAVTLTEIIDGESQSCDADCGDPIIPGDTCYIEHDLEWVNWYHRRCVDDVSKCANCAGRGHVFTESLQAHHLLSAMPRSSVRCEVCNGRGWIRPDA